MKAWFWKKLVEALWTCDDTIRDLVTWAEDAYANASWRLRGGE